MGNEVDPDTRIQILRHRETDLFVGDKKVSTINFGHQPSENVHPTNIELLATRGLKELRHQRRMHIARALSLNGAFFAGFSATMTFGAYVAVTAETAGGRFWGTLFGGVSALASISTGHEIVESAHARTASFAVENAQIEAVSALFDQAQVEIEALQPPEPVLAIFDQDAQPDAIMSD